MSRRLGSYVAMLGYTYLNCAASLGFGVGIFHAGAYIMECKRNGDLRMLKYNKELRNEIISHTSFLVLGSTAICMLRFTGIEYLVNRYEHQLLNNFQMNNDVDSDMNNRINSIVKSE